MSKFPLIVFEGIDGSGKTHHINKVKTYLKKRGVKYILLREPGGSINSEKIRKVILDKKNNFNESTDLFLYMASRSENVNLIKKSLNKKAVLIDRFIDSTIAYQHYGQNLNLKLITTLNNFLLKDLKITHTFLLKMNKRNLFKRLNKKRKNRYDNFNLSFYNKVQNAYIKLAKKKISKYSIINTNLHKKINEKLIISKISEIFNK